MFIELLIKYFYINFKFIKKKEVEENYVGSKWFFIFYSIGRVVGLV